MQDTGPAFERFEFTTFLNESERARIGLLVLQSDQTMEQEMILDPHFLKLMQSF